MQDNKMQKWLSVIGIGESGLLGLSPIARSLVDQAEILVGGDRHLAMLPIDGRDRIIWTSPISQSIDKILSYRGRSVCVLASGDPMCYGIGVMLTRQIALAEITMIPAPSTFSLACARLGWSLTDVETLSLCGRPPALVQAVLYPGAKLLILSEGRQTPAIVADLLTQSGYGHSRMTVLERLGGAQERLVEDTAQAWSATAGADLNAIAVECIAKPGMRLLSRLPGLPDNAFHHDGQLTKREIRSVTLSSLAPVPGALLWDVGAGCGSIAIEWMRSHPRCRAIAIEQNAARLGLIANNAAALGVPNLQIVSGTAPDALRALPPPDAIFIGGGATAEQGIETCWTALRSGGRLVANAVTVESELKLLEWQQHVGGDLTRMAVQRAEAIGSFLGWKPMAPITQWVVVKP